MKTVLKTFLIATLFLAYYSSKAQKTEPANVYPSNIEENMYIESYDADSKVITNINFLILCDGTNSEYITPSFEILLYLLPEGKTSMDDLIKVKEIKNEGIHHYGSIEYKNINLDLSSVLNLKSGNYRLGLWVNSDNSFKQDDKDDAILFKGVIFYDSTTPVKKTIIEQPKQEESKEDNNDSGNGE